jgi:hypothetical protein
MDAYQYFRLAIDHGIDFEVVGLQLYHGAATRWVRDMTEQSALLDRFARLGKPIHITEVQTPSATDLDLLAYARSWDPAHSGYWHRPWDPEIQADWVEQFYTVAVGKPYVDAVSWWSMSDRGTFFPHGGVLDQNDEPKPAFHRLKALIAGIRGEVRGDRSAR